jgi:hypothetical protein
MKLFLKRLKSNKGITLSELMVGLVVLSILILMVGALMTNVTGMQRRAIELTELNTLVDNVSNPIVKDLTNIAAGAPVVFCNFAICQCTDDCTADVCDSAIICPFNCVGVGINRVTINISGLGSVTYSIDDEGVLFKSCISPECPDFDPNPALNCNGHAVYQKDYYKNRSILFTVEDAPGTGVAYILTVILTDDRRGGIELLSRQYATRPMSLNQYTP